MAAEILRGGLCHRLTSWFWLVFALVAVTFVWGLATPAAALADESDSGSGSPLAALSTSDVVASGTCGTDATWTLTADGTLTISGTGEMNDYSTLSSAPWESYAESILSLVVGGSITSIGAYAFYDCEMLVSVELPDSLTTIGTYAFAYCDTLASVDLPDSLTTIGAHSFSGCTSLASVTLPASLASIDDYTFAYCDSLADLDLPDSLTAIGERAFAYCDSLADLDLPDSLTAIGAYAFCSCDSLADVDLPDTLITIGTRAFSYCGSLESVGFSDSLTTIGSYAFYYCDSLTSVCLPDSLVVLGTHAFYLCTALTSVEVSDSLTSISAYAFSGCVSLATVYLPGSLVYIGASAFVRCSSLTDVYYGGSEEDWAQISIGSDNTYLTSATIHYNSVSIDADDDGDDDGTTDDGNDDAGDGDGGATDDVDDSDDDGGTSGGSSGSGGGASGDADDSSSSSDKETAAYSFSDVQDAGIYYYAPVYAVAEAGYMTGMSDDVFGVGMSLKRQQMVTILYRIFGDGSYGSTSNSAAYADNATPLTDVADGEYYTAAVNWAYETGVATGYANGEFGVGDKCSFQQFCTFLARALGKDSTLSDLQAKIALATFSDGSKVAAYADNSVAYLCLVAYDDEGDTIVGGTAAGKLKPASSVSRERTVTVLYRCMEAELF